MMSQSEAVASQVADEYIHLGQLDRARALLERLLVTQGRKPWMLYQLSQVLLLQASPYPALQLVREAAQSQCNDDCNGRCQLCQRIMTQEGDILMELHKFEEAAEVRGSCIVNVKDECEGSRDYLPF